MLPLLVVRLHFARAREMGVAAAAVFVDLRAAFYTVLVEELLGPLLVAEARAAALQHAGLTLVEAAAFETLYIEHGPRISAGGLAATWAVLLADWQQRPSFRVKDGCRVVRLRTGTKPGVPLADVLFCLTFVSVQKEIMAELLTVIS